MLPPDREECSRVCDVCCNAFGSGSGKWDDKFIVDKLIGVLEKTKETIQILKELELTELARSVDCAVWCNENKAECRMEAQCKKDAEQDCTAASSKNLMVLLKKHEMENRNAPDKKTSSKLIMDCVGMGIFPNTKFAHLDCLHHSEKMEGMTKEEKNQPFGLIS